MATWQSGYVEVNGLRLHYTRTGGDKPPVVLAHGFSDVRRGTVGIDRVRRTLWEDAVSPQVQPA